MTLQHSRLSFGQAVRRAKRAGQLRQYRRTSTERVAVVADRQVERLVRRSEAPFLNWARRPEWDGADTSDAWSGGFAENH